MPPDHFKKVLIIWTVFSAFTVQTNVSAQEDSLQVIPTHLQDQIESLFDNSDSDADFDFNSLGETYSNYLQNPLPVNRASMTQLEELNLLSDHQISDFLHYRKSLGPLKSIYELQSIPSFDQITIDKLLPFITLDEERIFNARSVLKMVAQGRNELYLRGTRILEPQRGYIGTDGQNPKYLGGPNQYYLRYKHQFEQNLSYGITLEKDPGEPFFEGINKNGFDYYGYHFYVKNVDQHIETLALGDFAISLGQGLIIHSGYGGGKSSFVTQIKRGGRTIRPFTSVNESAALRGVATTIKFNPFAISIFASQRKQDGNTQVDTTDNFDDFISFTSLQTSGLHRTKNEIEDKRAITHQVLGSSIQFESTQFKGSFNLVHNHFKQPLQRRDAPYNQFYFQGKNLFNGSFDYSYRFKNLHLFGETAGSDNSALAHLHGALLGLSRYIDLTLLYRNLSPNYQALQANPFIESSQPNNERGLYIGSQIKINPAFWISFYNDYWTHPWLRFGVDAPSAGSESFIRLTYYQKRKLEAYIQWRSKNRESNFRTESDHLNKIRYGNRNYVRIHFSYKAHKNLELRNRLEFSHVTSEVQPKSRGFLVFQDFIYRPFRFPLSFTSRLCYFDTDNYASRIYTYENDILYSFSIPSFYNEGIRFYLNLRWRLGTLTIETRFEQTRYLYEKQISSGNEQINGNTRTRVKLQCRYIF